MKNKFYTERIRNIVIALAAVTLLTSATNDNFKPIEQQQISIATPGLFERSNAFTVDFATTRTDDYCFPLPVGKAKKTADNTLKITTSKGDAVKAMFGGRIRLSKHIQGHGNVIVVRHDNGLETVYGHNAQNLVKVGQRVKAGQTIAIVGGKDGNTFCTFSIMVNGGRINPATIINIDNHKLLRQTILCKKSGNHVNITVTIPDKEQKVIEERNRLEAKAKSYTKNPFADGSQFSINFAELNPGEWRYPLPGAKVISRYGRRGGRMHSGVDLKTKPNDKILAAFDGVVTMSQRYSAYGNYIKIRHANGIETCYSHNSKNLVKKGDIVKAGQVIALTGRTGRASTEHLHFECRINGQTFDPSKIFDHANHSIKMEQLTFTKRGRSVSIKTEKNYMAKGK